jgi:CheY-like chemotaxis protein
MPTLEKPLLLIVDDKRANQLALEALLGGEYRTLRANSGSEAIATLLERSDVDVILLDVQMPGMDGFETAAAIKKIEAARDIPIIFVTAVYNEDPHVKRGYAAGGVDYFGKPFDPDILKLKLRIYASFRSRENLLRQRELHIRESEELLRASRKLSSVLEGLPVGVLIADVGGRICQTTDEALRIFKSIEPAASDASGEIISAPLARALGGKASHSEPAEVTCVDGSSRKILVSASPLCGLDGALVGAVVLLQDRTEPRSIEQALEQRVARLISLGVELEQSAARPS